jgi:prophage DNA circulation protein
VHPSRGRLTVTLVEYDIAERWDNGPFFEVVFTFIQSGEQLFPAVLAALSSLVGDAAKLADAAGLGGFVSKVAGPLGKGLDAAASIATTAGQWLDKAESLARDATGLYGTLSQLGGADFGRYFNGRNVGFLTGLSSVYAGASSVTDLIQLGSAQRAAVGSAADAVKSTISSLGVGSGAADVAAQVQSAVAALAGSAADPKDGVRILGDLAKFAPAGQAAASAAGQATTDLFQRAASAAIARVSSTYAPASADDAHAVRAAVLAPIQAAIAHAGETGEDDVFSAFRALRKTVVQDLGERGAALPGLADLKFATNLPSVVLAHRQYGDAGREGELVTQADPVHPWFMPTEIRALAY